MAGVPSLDMWLGLQQTVVEPCVEVVHFVQKLQGQNKQSPEAFHILVTLASHLEQRLEPYPEQHLGQRSEPHLASQDNLKNK